MSIVHLNIIPRVEAYEVSTPNLAAEIRSGTFDKARLGELYDRIGFAEWFARQGLEIYRKSVLSDRHCVEREGVP
jgi:hypothetical protein